MMSMLKQHILVTHLNSTNQKIMVKPIIVKDKIKNFNKTININGDKSLSIRWALLASQAIGKSRAFNILRSEDVLNTLACLKKLGIKVVLNKKYCEIYGRGINGFIIKKNTVLNAGNSGTLGRLLLGLLVKSEHWVKLIGDKSLSKRDFSRVIEPLKKFGVEFYPKNKKTLPFFIRGTKYLKPIKFIDDIGSAQIKTCICFAALNSPGQTLIKSRRCRNHTEILFNHLKIPIKIKKEKKYDIVKVEGLKNFYSFDYKIPSDPSSSAFFVVLTILSDKSKILIKNVNINTNRIGFIKILKEMGAKITFKNKRTYKGEVIADIFCISQKNLKSISLPKSFSNSSAIDEFLLIFICCAFAKGISSFNYLQELNKKESRRLDWAFKILKIIGVKTQKIKNHGIKIFGDPKLQLKKNYVIKNFLKDHRIVMATTILGLAKGGSWKISDPDSVKTSFPNFFKITKKIGAKIN